METSSMQSGNGDKQQARAWNGKRSIPKLKWRYGGNKCLTPCCHPASPNTTMSTNFALPTSYINGGSSTTWSLCFVASGTSFAVVHGTCAFIVMVAMVHSSLKSKKKSCPDGSNYLPVHTLAPNLVREETQTHLRAFQIFENTLLSYLQYQCFDLLCNKFFVESGLWFLNPEIWKKARPNVWKLSNPAWT